MFSKSRQPYNTSRFQIDEANIVKNFTTSLAYLKNIFLLCSVKYFLKDMNKNDVLENLRDIKQMMEKSSRFQAINGVSIIIVGIYACIASAVACYLIGGADWLPFLPKNDQILHLNTPTRIRWAVILAAGLFLLSFFTVTAMAHAKAKRHQLRFEVDKRLLQMIFNFLLPLGVGAVLCTALILQGHYGLTSSVMLLFYGLALVNCQHYTYPSLRFLGYGEILLGIIDCFSIHHALLFWFLGFGVLHILFGILYTLKYDRKK
jgi:hypothetical protein